MPRTAEELTRIFRTRFVRRLDKSGYVRFRRWRIYGERGLAEHSAAVWLLGEMLTVEYAEVPLSQFKVAYQPDRRRLSEVTDPVLFTTPYASYQLPLWELSDEQWAKALRLPAYAPRRKRAVVAVQEALFPPIMAADSGTQS